MTRSPHAENAALRHRLRQVQNALQVALAALKADDDPARSWLVSHLSATLESDGASQRPPSITTREPAAGTDPHIGESRWP